MPSRRDHERFALSAPIEGNVDVLREVVICPATDDDSITVISRAAAVRDEVMTLELVDAAGDRNLTVIVVESRPVMFQGEVRHRVLFRRAAAAANAAVPATDDKGGNACGPAVAG